MINIVNTGHLHERWACFGAPPRQARTHARAADLADRLGREMSSPIVTRAPSAYLEVLPLQARRFELAPLLDQSLIGEVDH